jgi:sortase A
MGSRQRSDGGTGARPPGGPHAGRGASAPSGDPWSADPDPAPVSEPSVTLTLEPPGEARARELDSAASVATVDEAATRDAGKPDGNGSGGAGAGGPGEGAGSARSRPRRWPHRVLIAAGAALVLAAVGWQVQATLWTTHSERVGHALVKGFRDHEASLPVHASSGSSAALAACTTFADTDPVKGLLVIPALGVTGPVEQGVGNDQLDVAVGHLPDSVWPGQAGNSVLEAHDVSYFVNLARLKAGDTIEYQAPCTNFVFKVQSHTVVNQGTAVYNTSGPTLTLVTCWPTNALWFTPQRYLVTATLVSDSVRTGTSPTYTPATPPPNVAVPARLLSQGVTLATFSLPMGTMSVTGSGDQSWLQSTNPLLVEDSAVEAFIAGVRALEENRPDWWASFAPGAPIPPQLVGAHVSFRSPLDVQLQVAGAGATGAVLTDTVSLTGGSAPGHYAMTVTESVQAGGLTITNWVLQPD